MTAYITLVIITAFFSIILTFKVIGKVTLAWLLQWLLGVTIGIFIFYYATLPLMAWSVILNVLFWTFSLLQLILVLKELLSPGLTKTVTVQDPIVVTYGHATDTFATEKEALYLMNHLQNKHVPFKVTGLR